MSSDEHELEVELMGSRYTYEGPEALGSIVSHYCHALRMESSKEAYDWRITAYEVQGKYFLVIHKVTCQPMGDEGSSLRCLCQEFQHQDQEMRTLTFIQEASADGRAAIGRALYSFLAHELGVPKGEWGDLVGVRPVKYFNKKREQLGSEEAVFCHLTKERYVSEQKASLLQQVAKMQEPLVTSIVPRDRQIALYGNIPFCTTHCVYCSFPYGIIKKEEPLTEWVDAFLRDIHHAGEEMARYQLKATSAYLGGGTPTALGEIPFSKMVHAFSKLLEEGTEFTVEAGRPDTVTEGKLKAMVEAGATRISINPQTMQDELLRLIARGHSVSDILTLYEKVRVETKLMINMDFIAGLPDQKLAHMEENLNHVAALMPENVTIHTLALKKGSPLFQSELRHRIASAEEARAMVEMAQEVLTKLGYVPYYLYRQQYMTGSLENVGYCLPESMCHYNVMMMEERQPVLSVGPGSTTKWMMDQDFTQLKQYMPKDVPTYMRELEQLLNKRHGQMKECYGEA